MVLSPVVLLQIQLLANVPGNAAKHGLDTWIPTITVRDPNEVPSSWLLPGLALASDSHGGSKSADSSFLSLSHPSCPLSFK